MLRIIFEAVSMIVRTLNYQKEIMHLVTSSRFFHSIIQKPVQNCIFFCVNWIAQVFIILVMNSYESQSQVQLFARFRRMYRIVQKLLIHSF